LLPDPGALAWSVWQFRADIDPKRPVCAMEGSL
jgi:hypothetical protein